MQYASELMRSIPGCNWRVKIRHNLFKQLANRALTIQITRADIPLAVSVDKARRIELQNVADQACARAIVSQPGSDIAQASRLAVRDEKLVNAHRQVCSRARLRLRRCGFDMLDYRRFDLLL